MVTEITYNSNGGKSVDGQMIKPPLPHSLEPPQRNNDIVDECFGIPLKTLQVDTIPGFNIYLNVKGKNEYVLYRSGEIKFTEEHKEKLSSNMIGEIFIKSSQRQLYSKYIEDNLTEIIADQSFPRDKKSTLVYKCSTDLLQNIFDGAQIADRIPRVTKLVRNTVEHLYKGIDEFISLLDRMSHDYYTVTHSVNVCIIGVALGQRIGLNRNELNDLGTGLLLHDLGKSKIDNKILYKKGPLNESEWKIIKKHPHFGAVIAENTNRVSPLSLTVIRQHHEKCSGRGYPIGLYEPQIHLYSRIAGLADVYDALTTERPYEAALDAFQAIQLMQREMANAFSPDLFKELVLLLNNKEGQSINN